MGDDRGGGWHSRRVVNSLVRRGILQPLTPDVMRPGEDTVLAVVDAGYALETLYRPLRRGELPMQNVNFNVTDDNRLIIEIHLKESKKDKIKFSPSASGKTIVGASTRGNVQIPDTDWFLGLNLYKYPDAD